MQAHRPASHGAAGAAAADGRGHPETTRRRPTYVFVFVCLCVRVRVHVCACMCACVKLVRGKALGGAFAAASSAFTRRRRGRRWRPTQAARRARFGCRRRSCLGSPLRAEFWTAQTRAITTGVRSLRCSDESTQRTLEHLSRRLPIYNLSIYCTILLLYLISIPVAAPHISHIFSSKENPGAFAVT